MNEHDINRLSMIYHVSEVLVVGRKSYEGKT